jgi:tetratricopeptide (TPR) repeat protein
LTASTANCRHSASPPADRAGVRPKGVAAGWMCGRLTWLALLLLLVAMVGGGCASTKQERRALRAVDDYFAGNYAAARERLRPLAEKTDENFVLNNVRLGSAALVDYDLNEAEDAFLRAYEVINSVGVNDGGRSLGAVLVDEKLRVWKGEPYERAMVNFYLGLIYYMRQDYNNARAAFENALFKLRDYQNPRQRDGNYAEQESNFVAGLIMLGKSWQKLGRDDLARATFQRVHELRPDLRALADYERNERANLLLVIDFGYGPHKVTDFDGSIVGFSPHPGQAGLVPEPRIRLGERYIDTSGVDRPPFDLLAMAQDRRWQSLDTLRAVKSGLGTGLIYGGAATGIYGADRGNDSTVAAGLAMMGAGLLLKATSQADVRQWEMLPRTTFIVPLQVPPGTHDLTVDFPRVYGLRQTWRNIVVPDQGEAVYYIRMQRWHSGPFDWPPPAIAGAAGSDPLP